MTHTIVFVSKFYHFSNILMQIASLMYPHLDIEVAKHPDAIVTQNPFRVIALLEDDQSDCDILMKRFPGKLRFLSRNTLITDFDQFAKDEGIDYWSQK